MYEPHFGLSLRPFAETVDPSVYVPLPSRESSLRRLRYGLEQVPGPVLAFGPPGTGKTLLAQVLAQAVGDPVVHLAFPVMPAGELLAYLADELGAPTGSGGGMAGSLRRLRNALASAADRGRRPTLIVDEAHLIDDPETFEAIRLLLNFTTAGLPDLALVLVGGTSLLLKLPTAMADRLAAQTLIGPLSEEESAFYITTRLKAAGASSPLFSPLPWPRSTARPTACPAASTAWPTSPSWSPTPASNPPPTPTPWPSPRKKRDTTSSRRDPGRFRAVRGRVERRFESSASALAADGWTVHGGFAGGDK